jgi:hypothetical protein
LDLDLTLNEIRLWKDGVKAFETSVSGLHQFYPGISDPCQLNVKFLFKAGLTKDLLLKSTSHTCEADVKETLKMFELMLEKALTPSFHSRISFRVKSRSNFYVWLSISYVLVYLLRLSVRNSCSMPAFISATSMAFSMHIIFLG